MDTMTKLASIQQHYYAQGQAQAIKAAGLTKEARAGKLKKLLAITGAGGAGVGAGLGINRLRLAPIEAGIAANEARAAQLAEMAAAKAETRAEGEAVIQALSQLGQRASSGLNELLAAARQAPAAAAAAAPTAPTNILERMSAENLVNIARRAPAPRSLSGFTAENIVDMATRL